MGLVAHCISSTRIDRVEAGQMILSLNDQKSQRRGWHFMLLLYNILSLENEQLSYTDAKLIPLLPDRTFHPWRRLW